MTFKSGVQSNSPSVREIAWCKLGTILVKGCTISFDGGGLLGCTERVTVTRKLQTDISFFFCFKLFYDSTRFYELPFHLSTR
jgi:hypothetical protein